MHGARDGAAGVEEGVVVAALFLALALAVVDEEDAEEPELDKGTGGPTTNAN
jgi:hypothetical protein